MIEIKRKQFLQVGDEVRFKTGKDVDWCDARTYAGRTAVVREVHKNKSYGNINYADFFGHEATVDEQYHVVVKIKNGPVYWHTAASCLESVG